MPGRWYTLLFDVATGQNGYVTTADIRELGGTQQVLVDMQRHQQLDRVGHGLYRFPAFPRGPLDELMEATLWPRRLGVISHESALDLWDLCDVNPAKIHLTVPRSARIRRTVPAVYHVHVRDLDEADTTRFEGIPVVTPARAILDGIEQHLNGRLITQAIDSANRRGLISGDETRTLQGSR